MASRESEREKALAAWKFEPRGTGGEKNWIVQASERDMEFVVRALQKELNSAPPDRSNCDNMFMKMNMKKANGNDDIIITSSSAVRLNEKPRSIPAGGMKRRSAVRSPVTFVTADPNNFRAMVQHATGSVDNTAMRGTRVLKPQPKRPCTSTRVLKESTSYSGFPGALPSLSPALHNPLPEASPPLYLFPEEHFASIDPIEFWTSIMSHPPDGSTFQNSQKHILESYD